MTSQGREGVRAIAARDETALHAYHDRELRGLARWRFERRLARSPELRRELENLRRLRALAVEADRAADSPDLWEGIARRLSAVDAKRARAEADREPQGPARWLEPLGALSAAAATAALVFALWYSDTADAGVVRWIDSGDRNVLVLEDDDEATIIWVLGQAPDEAAQGGGV